MIPDLPGHCYYCDVQMNSARVDPVAAKAGRTRPNQVSVEHVYPWRMRKKRPPEQRTARWDALNRVAACCACNSLKGELDPIDWLVIMPNKVGAKRLAGLLVLLGVPVGEVNSAMRRRKR